MLQISAAFREETDEYVTFTANLPTMMRSQEEFTSMLETTESAKSALANQFLGSFFL